MRTKHIIAIWGGVRIKLRFRVGKISLSTLDSTPLPSTQLHPSTIDNDPLSLVFSYVPFVLSFLFLISSSLGASGRLCFVIVEFPGYLYL